MPLAARILPFSLLVALAPACFDPSSSDETSGGTVAATTSSGSADDASTMTSAAVTESSTGPGTEATSSSSSAADSTTGGGGPPTFCLPPDAPFGGCELATEGAPHYGVVACDPSDTMFKTFYEDVYEVVLSLGDCLYIRVDNIGEAGPTGVAAADMAIQIRSPSGLYAFVDDTAACTDPTWTGAGSCPQAAVIADVTGTFSIAVVQASGGGCLDPAPYAIYADINGTAVDVGAAATEDALTVCP